MTVHQYMEELSWGSQPGYKVDDPATEYEEQDREVVTNAVKALASVANHASPQILANHFVSALQGEHRYLQGELVCGLIGALCRYSQASYDGRNQYAVAACKVIDDLAYEQALGAFRARAWKQRTE